MFWTAVLDDLEGRVAAAEAGDLAALEGWTHPGPAPQPMDAAEASRARRVVARQQALMAVLRTRQAEVARARSQVRRPKFISAAPAPVYLDRTA